MFTDMQELTLDRDTTVVSNVGNISLYLVFFILMKELTLYRFHTTVGNVNSLIHPSRLDGRERTVIVEKHSACSRSGKVITRSRHLKKSMNKLKLERNPMDMGNVP
jgi:hypothetical protein